jgi:hypothetical protein
LTDEGRPEGEIVIIYVVVVAVIAPFFTLRSSVGSRKRTKFAQ